MKGINLVVLGVVGLVLFAGCAASPAPSATPSDEGAKEDLAASELEQQRDRILFLYPEAEIPSVQRVRYVDQHEWPAVQAECRTEAGFTSIAEADGGVVTAGIPAEQREAWLIAKYVCLAQYPLDPKYLVPLNNRQLEALYSYYIDELVPCLEAEGQTLPTPPSKSHFLESYGSAAAWNPYEEVVVGDQTQWDQLNALCPQQPSALYD